MTAIANNHGPPARSFRVAQVEGMFDVSLEAAASVDYQADIPGLDQPWTIGAIVGPSASGKSTVARQTYGPAMATSPTWPTELPLIDALPAASIHQLTATLTSVGLGSVPAWLRPYHVLSGGEQFRADVARALLQPGQVAVIDEFTSLLDRTTAQFACLALGKALRGGAITKRLIAVTCHADMLDWLAPDWVVEMPGGDCHWRSLRRPHIPLDVSACSPEIWRLFAPHHYLNSGPLPVAQFFAAWWNQTPVAVAALVGLWGRAGHKRVARLVTQPQFQGVGIGGRLLDCVATWQAEEGFTTHITAGHPAIWRHCRRSAHWQLMRCYPIGRRPHQAKNGKPVKSSLGRPVMSFRFARGN